MLTSPWLLLFTPSPFPGPSAHTAPTAAGGASAPRPAAMSLVDRAQRLANAVQAISRGLHATADVLSPRAKLMQAALVSTTTGG